MANDPAEAAPLHATLAKTTAAALAVSRAEGPDFFKQLALNLAEILEVDSTMIGTFDEVQPRLVHAIATSLDGRMLQPYDYDIEDTPCRVMLERDTRFVASGLHPEFLPGTLFHAQGIDSYAAHVMLDAAGRRLGLVVAMHRKPMTDRELTEALLKIFAARAGAELQRLRADTAARVSEASYRAIFDASEDAIFVHDFEHGSIVDVNPKACRVYGYTHDEMLRVRIAEVSANEPPYTEADAIGWIERAKQQDGPVRFEWHRRSRDGSLHWDEVVLKKATIGGVPRVLAFTREITQRKAAEEALRLREEQYRAIFEGSADALVLWNRDIRIVDVNAAFTEMYGYTRQEIIGSTFGDRLPTLDIARRIRMMHGALAGQKGLLETRTIRKNGEAFDVEIRYLPIQHRGEPHVLAIARDITARRQTEQRLKASEAQYRSIFEAATDALQLLDARHRVVDVNPAYERLYGKRREDVVGKSLDELVRPEFRAERTALVDRALAGEVAELQSNGFRKDGTPFDLEVRCIPFEHHGEPHVLGIARDITERKRAENALRASEERYRLLFEMESAAIVLVDADTLQLVDVNVAAVQMYGYSREELLQLTATDLSNEPQLTAPSIQEGQGELNIPLRWHRRKDGGVFPVEITANRLELDGRRIVLATVRDISERRERDEAIRRSSARLRATVEAAFDCVIGMDEHGRIIEFNGAAERCFGHRRDEVIGCTLADTIIPPHLREQHKRGMQHYLASGRGPYLGRLLETTGMRADGTEFPVELAVAVAQSGSESIFIGYLRDITERKRTEQALRDSEEQYRAIFHASADGMYLRDGTYRIVDVNPAYLLMKGYAREELVGSDMTMPSPGRTESDYREDHARVLAGESLQYEAKAQRKDGSWFDVEVRGMPLLYRGQPHVLYTVRDTTERRRAEDERRALEGQLLQAQKMEAIGHLTGGIAHDFNNILTSVMGYVALAAERPSAEADAKLQSHLDNAQAACRRARDLIQQMLTFSRGKRGVPRPVPLRSLVGESTRMLRVTLPATLELKHSVDGDPTALVDPVQAHQVLLNLCINARDAMEEIGRITVQGRRRSVRGVTCASCRHTFDGDFAELSVIDSGAGIPVEVAERMFEPFYSTKETGHGTGMGLAIVHGIVHDHEGHLLLDTSPRGTTFSVLLPLATADDDAEADTAEPSRRRASLHGRVLLVEDEQSVIGFMRELLESWGATVVAARDPSDALRWFELEPERFDLMLTDQTMPGMTGIELARAVLAHRPDLPVLLYSGRSELLHHEAAAAAGVRRVLAKPVDPDLLHQALQETLPVAAV